MKGAAAPRFVHDPGRLRHPMRHTAPKTADDPGWERISWAEALEIATGRPRALALAHGPESVEFSHAGDRSPFPTGLPPRSGLPTC